MGIRMAKILAGSVTYWMLADVGFTELVRMVRLVGGINYIE